MTNNGSHRGAHRGKPSTLPRVAVGLAVLATVCLAAVLVVPAARSLTVRDERVVETPGKTARTSPTAGGGEVADARPARRTGAVPERPISARLPSGKVVAIRAVSTTANGTLDVPSDIAVSGWWRGGSRIGDPFGSTLLAAHVDSATQGLGPYAELLSVRAGQRVVLVSAHLQQEFAIRSLRLVSKKELSSTHWIYSSSGARRVVLVTCAGPYVRSSGGYQRLAVVTATPLGDPTRRTG